MSSPTTKSHVAKFTSQSSGLISEDRAAAFLQAMAALEHDFGQLKQLNEQTPGVTLKATYEECEERHKSDLSSISKGN